MLKRLTMIAVGLGIIGFCMGMMPQKAEAAVVWHQVYHSGPNGERGYTTIRVGSQWSGPNYFSIWLNSGYAIHWSAPVGYGSHYCRMNCGASQLRYQNIPWYETTVTFRL